MLSRVRSHGYMHVFCICSLSYTKLTFFILLQLFLWYFWGARASNASTGCGTGHSETAGNVWCSKSIRAADYTTVGYWVPACASGEVRSVISSTCASSRHRCLLLISCDRLTGAPLPLARWGDQRLSGCVLVFISRHRVYMSNTSWELTDMMWCWVITPRLFVRSAVHYQQSCYSHWGSRQLTCLE